MSQQDSRTDNHQTQFANALKQLMVAHGLGSVRARGATGFLGLTPAGKFETTDLAFKFMAPDEHLAAAQALGLPAPQIERSGRSAGPQDMERFVRATGQLFDEYGVMNLEFTREALLGFIKTGHTVDFVVEGVALTLR